MEFTFPENLLEHICRADILPMAFGKMFSYAPHLKKKIAKRRSSFHSAWRLSGTDLILRVRPYDSLLQIQTGRVFKELFYRNGHNAVLVTFQKHFITGYNDFLERVTDGAERA